MDHVGSSQQRTPQGQTARSAGHKKLKSVGGGRILDDIHPSERYIIGAATLNEILS
jgi:hypothetical protein